MNDAQSRAQLDETVEVTRSRQDEPPRIRRVADDMIDIIRSGHRIFLCGNGGSALDVQHFAAELVGHFRVERAPLPTIALNADVAILTAVASDYDYADVFARQVKAFGTGFSVLEDAKRALDPHSILSPGVPGLGEGARSHHDNVEA